MFRVLSHRLTRMTAALAVSLALALGGLGLVAAPAEAVAKAKVTNAEYAKIKAGQTLSQVRAIIGGAGSAMGADAYRWEATRGRVVVVAFAEGRVVLKDRLVVVSPSEYKKIKKGMRYDRVRKIIGGPSQLSIQDDTIRYRMWFTSDLTTFVVLSFKRGKVATMDLGGDIFGDLLDEEQSALRIHP